jgi:hypothetical protein
VSNDKKNLGKLMIIAEGVELKIDSNNSLLEVSDAFALVFATIFECQNIPAEKRAQYWSLLAAVVEELIKKGKDLPMQ